MLVCLIEFINLIIFFILQSFSFIYKGNKRILCNVLTLEGKSALTRVIKFGISDIAPAPLLLTSFAGSSPPLIFLAEIEKLT